MRKISFNQGDKVGMCFFIREVDPLNGKRRAIFICKCGKEFESGIQSIRNQNNSCGCVKKQSGVSKLTKHGLSGIAEHLIWSAAKSRCFNPKNKSYDNYGGRGIVMSKEWSDSFQKFYEDMGPRPSPELSLERNDNDGPYSKENCKWGTKEEQDSNKRSSVKLTFNGEILTISQWAKRLGFNRNLIRDRINRGWSVEDSLTKTPMKALI